MNGKHAYNAALKKVKASKGYSVFAWEVLTVGETLFRCALELGEDEEGYMKWDDSTEKTCVISDEEAQAEQELYERETGNCGECMGTGKVWAGWSVESGNTYCPCKECNATGFCAVQRSLFECDQVSE